jgi:hypothetical protein
LETTLIFIGRTQSHASSTFHGKSPVFSRMARSCIKPPREEQTGAGIRMSFLWDWRPSHDLRARTGPLQIILCAVMANFSERGRKILPVGVDRRRSMLASWGRRSDAPTLFPGTWRVNLPAASVSGTPIARWTWKTQVSFAGKWTNGRWFLVSVFVM